VLRLSDAKLQRGAILKAKSNFQRKGSQLADRLRMSNSDELFFKASKTTALRIPPLLASREPGLMTTKWYEYRFMPAYGATKLFVVAYQNAFRMKWERNFDTREAPLKTGIRSNDWESSPREFTSFWQARQTADEAGAPYDFFCERAFEFLLRRGWTRIPRPNQLYGDKHRALIRSFVLNSWLEHTSDYTQRLAVSNLPQYRIENAAGDVNQYAHQDWVAQQIHSRSMRPGAIAQACFEDCVLDPQYAYFEFGPNRFNRAVEEGSTATHLTKIEPDELRPSCFGVLHARNTASSACATCRFSEECDLLSEFAKRHVVKVSGSTNPALARRRMLTRSRVQKHRQLRAAAALRSPDIATGS
jgi:hypothetical protein